MEHSGRTICVVYTPRGKKNFRQKVQLSLEKDIRDKRQVKNKDTQPIKIRVIN